MCNPNNPTGGILQASAISAFVERLAVESPQTVVLVDEAYYE
jgi:histidinol-phosphate/aromatic aminotransferase/cobyric acid decarboxylase-like protein